jgi:hypothetical protein
MMYENAGMIINSCILRCTLRNRPWRTSLQFIGLSDFQRTHLTKRSSQSLAVPMSSFHMTSTLNDAAKLAPASGG